MSRRSMHDPQDQLDLGTPPPPGIPPRRPAFGPHAAPPAAELVKPPPGAPPEGKRFLSVWWTCCHSYGRLARRADGAAFEGRCPRCGREASARIGPGGSARRIFTAT